MAEYIHWSQTDSASFMSESQIRSYIAAFDAELKLLIQIAKTDLNLLGRVTHQFSDGYHGLVLNVECDPATNNLFYTVQACKIYCGFLMVGLQTTAAYDDFDGLEKACRIVSDTYLPY